MPQPALQYVLSAREYDLLKYYISDNAHHDDHSSRSKPSSSLFLSLRRPSTKHDHNASAIRSASRLYLATRLTLQSVDSLRLRLSSRRHRGNLPPSKLKPLIAHSNRLALSLATLLFLHRILFRFLTRLRLHLLHEKAARIRLRYPRLHAALTSPFTPAVGASLAGLALGIYPASQLRLTLAIYAGARGLEFLSNAFQSGPRPLLALPWWAGSWLIFAVSQGQLLHAFVFDRDCFPTSYSDFILSYTPEYIQRRPLAPTTISPNTRWPPESTIVDALATMATLRWPRFTSPLLHPGTPSTAHLPPGIPAAISPITSRASPLITSLSCALIHPSSPSCLLAYLRQNLLAFPRLVRFFAMYYGAFSVLRYKSFARDPLGSANRLAEQVLRTSAAISGAIGASWGGICLFGWLFPGWFLPKGRFVLAGLLGGSFQFVDRRGAGRGNSLYAGRVSADSLWKVGVKRGWWRGIKGGDVYVFVVGLMVMNVVFQWKGEKGVDSGVVRGALRVLRGEGELGLRNGGGKAGEKNNGRKEEKMDESSSWEKVEKEE